VAAIRATNRTQRLVLGFFAAVWVALVAILLTAPEIYDSTLRLGPDAHLLPDLAFLIAISVLIAILVIAVLKRWRWAFWLVVIAFLFGILRVPASAMQLMNVLPTGGPTWYVLLQAAIGLAQFVIALAMIAGYRRAGVWGAF
jgi:hypothetical protein